MLAQRLTVQFLEAEASALRTRIDRMVPFSLSMTMVPAASVSPAAMTSIEVLLRGGRQKLRMALTKFLDWLRSPKGQAANPAEAQQRFTILRLHFHTVVGQFDLFADVLVQRSQHAMGVWIAGLDDLAADALRIPGHTVDAPQMVCYLDRGLGAAIRRARTRLPGGDMMPVAIIRVPRERMIGQGIGSSLVHEVGHQAAAVLDLLPPLRVTLLQNMRLETDPTRRAAWICWEKWCSEIVSDFWSVAYLGTSATIGLIGVVSLPRPFVFRIEASDPHPFAFIRVLTSAALGAALYPDPQWAAIAAMWEAMYPTDGLTPEVRLLIGALKETLPAFAAVLLNLRLPALEGDALGVSMRKLDRSPERLGALWQSIRGRPDDWHQLPPTLTLAAIGQARTDSKLPAEAESLAIRRVLTEWATQSALMSAAVCGRVTLLPPTKRVSAKSVHRTQAMMR